MRILFKSTKKAEEIISDEPYWADLPTKERYAYYRKDTFGVRTTVQRALPVQRHSV